MTVQDGILPKSYRNRESSPCHAMSKILGSKPARRAVAWLHNPNPTGARSFRAPTSVTTRALAPAPWLVRWRKPEGGYRKVTLGEADDIRNADGVAILDYRQ